MKKKTKPKRTNSPDLTLRNAKHYNKEIDLLKLQLSELRSALSGLSGNVLLMHTEQKKLMKYVQEYFVEPRGKK